MLINMNIDRYINWDEIWNREIDLQSCVDYLDDDNLIDFLKKFQYQLDNNPNLELNKSECEFDSDNKTLTFHFTESGGQNESDTQGWFMDYIIVVDSDFIIIDGEYQQG